MSIRKLRKELQGGEKDMPIQIKTFKRIIKNLFIPLPCFILLISIFGAGSQSPSPPPQQSPGDLAEQFLRRSKDAEARGLAEPFKGVTTNGTIVPNLFPVRSTGVSTDPVRKAADAFLATLYLLALTSRP